MSLFNKFFIFILSVSIISCSSEGRKRDNIVPVSLISIDDYLPPMHKATKIHIWNDKLVFYDIMSTEYKFLVYDAVNDSCIGWFGKHGPGPNEISNFGAECIDREKGILYGCD